MEHENLSSPSGNKSYLIHRSVALYDLITVAFLCYKNYENGTCNMHSEIKKFLQKMSFCCCLCWRV